MTATQGWLFIAAICLSHIENRAHQDAFNDKKLECVSAWLAGYMVSFLIIALAAFSLFKAVAG